MKSSILPEVEGFFFGAPQSASAIARSLKNGLNKIGEEKTMTPKEIFQTIKDKDVKYVDLRFTDTRGKEQHVSVPVKAFGPEKFESGRFFDGFSISGWKGLQASE